MSQDESQNKDEVIQQLKRQAMAAERLRFEAIRDLRLKQDPLRLDLLTFGVAHEFNNILGAAEGHAEWALDSKDPEDMKEALEIILMACQRSSQVTKALQGLVQPKEEEKKIFSLDEVIEDVSILFKATLAKAEVSLEKQIEVFSVYGNPSQLGEVLINLLKNSLDAFEGSDQEEKRILIQSFERENQYIVEFCDNGPGVPKVYQEMLFQPFFSTKGSIAAAVSSESGKNIKNSNSGLGLYLAKSIVLEHGGNLFLDTERAGACFVLELPKLKK